MSIDVVIQKDKVSGDLSVLFRVPNEPVMFLGEKFEARPTTLAASSWADAAAGRLPKEVTQDLSGDDIARLKKHTLDMLMVYGKNNPR